VRLHAHDECEQVMAVVDGDLTVTVRGSSKRLVAGDVVVISRGVEHEVRSDGGCTFFEALAPVPLDHVPDRERDLVLGPEGGRGPDER
jgi:quercetin dioxygenase-like cupin family protein